MTPADRIGHLCILSRSNVDHTVSSHTAEQFGYLDNLKQIAKDGGYIAMGTEEEIGMLNSARSLCKLAQEIMEARKSLLANDTRKLQAAE